ncbi:MAG: division/cell wall cluster transcriptional repressor MraZ [Chloroflexi bacterium]|nr:division/cell wall cluster transcriptional repressor MraZ [Chloroflexota bacterium]
MSFSGEFEAHVDSHGRVAVPSSFVEALSAGAIVARGFERCVSVYSKDGWERIAAEIGELPATDATTRRLARIVFASANDQQIDRQGRLELPKLVRWYAGIDHEVLVVGVGEVIEIWDKRAWVAEVAALECGAARETGIEEPAA